MQPRHASSLAAGVTLGSSVHVAASINFQVYCRTSRLDRGCSFLVFAVDRPASDGFGLHHQLSSESELTRSEEDCLVSGSEYYLASSDFFHIARSVDDLDVVDPTPAVPQIIEKYFSSDLWLNHLAGRIVK